MPIPPIAVSSYVACPSRDLLYLPFAAFSPEIRSSACAEIATRTEIVLMLLRTIECGPFRLPLYAKLHVSYACRFHGDSLPAALKDLLGVFSL